MVDQPGASPFGPLRRLLRVPVFTAATVGLGVGAHAGAGGRLPGAGPLLLLTATVLLVSGSLSSRERRLPALLLGVAAVQIGVHVALSSSAAAMGGADHAPGMGPDRSLPMVLTHAVASLLVAGWLRRGERAAWRLAEVAVRALYPELPPTPPLVLPGRRTLAFAGPDRPVAAPPISTLRGRGPPRMA